jgi:hypothetical protein
MGRSSGFWTFVLFALLTAIPGALIWLVGLLAADPCSFLSSPSGGFWSAGLGFERSSLLVGLALWALAILAAILARRFSLWPGPRAGARGLVPMVIWVSFCALYVVWFIAAAYLGPLIWGRPVCYGSF